MLDSALRMDRQYRWQRHIYDLTRRPYLLGRDALIRELRPPPGGTVLEIGCGTGRNLIRAARTFSDVECFGVDVSAVMLDTARASIERSGLQRRIRLAQADALAVDPVALFGRRSFDRVMVSYAFSMIVPWRQALAHAASMVGPGGSLHIVDFGDQARMPAWFRVLLLRWLDLFEVAPRTALRTEIEALAKQAAFDVRCADLYRGYAFLATLRQAPVAP
jgi:S-adenosylmethionine-diacylgycerolhomoserine-N-methlytransferase